MIKITKEQYLELKNSNNIAELEDKAFDLGLISKADKMGYGIKTINVYEKDGEYYLKYTTYDNCY